MKLQIILICTLIHLIANSCTTGVKGKYTSYINNSTPYKVAFKFYKEGKLVDSESRDDIIPNSVTTVLITPGDNLSIYPERISVYDSLVINFDTATKAIHYGSVSGMNPLGLHFSNKRNIFNKNNWEKKIITDQRKRQESEYTFTLSMQDYLDAKK